MPIMRVRTTISGLQGLPGVSTFYFRGTTTTPITADVTDVVARVRAFFSSSSGAFPALVSLQVLGDVDVIDEANGTLTDQLSVTAPAVVPGSSGVALPFASAVLLTHNTGGILNGRRLRGRSFLSPCNAAANTAGAVTTSLRTTVTTAANVMLTGTTGSYPVVWHRPKLPGPLGGLAIATTGYSVGTSFAVLRSRRD